MSFQLRNKCETEKENVDNNKNKKENEQEHNMPVFSEGEAGSGGHREAHFITQLHSIVHCEIQCSITYSTMFIVQ